MSDESSAVGMPVAAPLSGKSAYPLIYAVVKRIPNGRVATYGQVAALAGMRGHARLVGYALHSLPEGHSIPWHRVINAKGRISLRTGEGDWGDYQRHLLQQEGVRFDSTGRIPLAKYQWKPETLHSLRKDSIGSNGPGT